MMTNPPICHNDVLIVGAGPAGLSLGYELQQRNIDYMILEQAQVGWAWRNHYERLRLHTLKDVSALPGLAMPADYPSFPTREHVVAYLEQYAQYFDLAITCDVRVESAEWNAPWWDVFTSQGRYRARTLVMATGIWSTPYRPHLPGLDLFRGTVIHSQAYYNAEPFRGQRVLVVGVGNTGAEIAVELGQAGIKPFLWVRSGITMVPRPRSVWAMRAASWLFRHLPRRYANMLLARSRRSFDELGLPQRPVEPIDAYPVVGFELVESVRKGHVQVLNHLQTFTKHGVMLTDGTIYELDSIILATGFRPTIQPVAPYIDLDARGWPMLDQGRALRHDHLYGLGFTYPTTEGWLQAIGRTARAMAEQIAQQLHIPAPNKTT